MAISNIIKIRTNEHLFIFDHIYEQTILTHEHVDII